MTGNAGFLCAINSSLTGVKYKTDNLDSHFKVISSDHGFFPSLLDTNEMWFIVAQRLSISDGCAFLVNRYNNTCYVNFIMKSDSFTVATNEMGTVDVQFSGSNEGVFACAFRVR